MHTLEPGDIVQYKLGTLRSSTGEMSEELSTETGLVISVNDDIILVQWSTGQTPHHPSELYVKIRSANAAP